MDSIIGPVILGIIISVLGVFNMRGNISSVHWYHRQRVTEADRKPFGKLVGGGTLLIGVSLIVFGIFEFVAEKLQNEVFVTVGAVLMIAAIATGLIMNFYAMLKYNKGIF